MLLVRFGTFGKTNWERKRTEYFHLLLDVICEYVKLLADILLSFGTE